MGTRSVRVLFEFTTVPLEAFTKQVLNRLDIYINVYNLQFYTAEQQCINHQN